MTKEKLYQLMEAFQDGSISEADLLTLQAFVNTDAAEPWLQEIIDVLGSADLRTRLTHPQSQRMFDSIMEAVHQATIPEKRIHPRKLWYAAAAAAILLFSFFFFSPLDFLHSTNYTSQAHLDILPGHAKGNLLLDNGEMIDLEKLSANSRIVQQGYTIVKDSKGGISYKLTDDHSDHPLYNTIITPEGGEYKLSLPDGTKIWVNASSKIRYPLNFGTEKREVELDGEALFEVAKLQVGQRHIPFIVKTRQQTLQVLGTTFNINSYDTKIRTTLVEGAVRLTFKDKQQQELQPNQQANYDETNGGVEVQTIDPFYTIAWRNGSFAFDNTELHDVMATIARWYAVDVIYQGNFESIRFSGTISRNADIKKLLDLITLTGGVHFELKERRIIVMK